MLKVVVSILAGILFVLLLLVGMLQFMDWSYFKGAIESVAGWSLNREVEIGGDIDGKLFPTVQVSASEVRVGGKEGHYDRLASVGDFSISMPFMSVITMAPQVENISVNDSKVWLERQTRKKDATGDLALPDIGEASLRDIEVRYYLPGENREVTARIDSLEINEDGKSGLRLVGEGSLSEVPVSVTGNIPNPEDLEATDEPYPVSLKFTAAEDSLELSGTVSKQENLRFDISYSLEGDSLGRLLKQFGYRPGEVIAYSSRGKVSGSPEAFTVDPFQVTLGYSYGNGRFSIDRNGRTAIRGRIHFDRLRYQDIQTILPKEKEKRDFFSDEPFEFSFPEDLYVNLDISAQRIDFPAEENILNALAFHLVLKDERVTIDPVTLATADGKIKASAMAETRGKGLAVELEADLRSIGLSTLIAPFDQGLEGLGITDLAGGILYGIVDLAAKGGSMDQLMASLDGQVQMAVEDGYLSATAVEALGLDLGEFLVSVFAGDPKTAIECGILALDVDSGILRTRPVVLATEDTNIILRGQVNLDKETIDMTIHPRAKDFSILTGEVPIHITGSLQDLTVQPDDQLAAQVGLAVLLGIALGPVAAPLAFIEPGTGEEGICSQYVAKLREIEEKAEPS